MELQLLFTQTVTYKYYPSDEERDKDVMYTFTPKDKSFANEIIQPYEEENDEFY